MCPTNSPMAAAEKAAQSFSDSQAVGATVLPCTNNSEKKLKEVIKVKVVGEDGVGLADIALLLSREDKQVLTGKTAPDGVYAFKGLEPGSYQLSLPELDMDAWKELKTEALVGDEAKSSSGASWRSAPAETLEGEKIHVIKQGECVGKIAEVYGFFPRTIWDYEKNSELRELRHDNMYILFPEDNVVIPAKRQKAQAVNTGYELTVQRQGVPERLRIRFLHYDETPRLGVPYLLSLKTDKGVLVADISSETDGKGFVNQSISVGAKLATIILNPGPWAETYDFNLRHIDPIDEVSGWQARLKNLGYYYGEENGLFDDQTRLAICAFQNAKQIDESGEMDMATQAILLALALA